MERKGDRCRGLEESVIPDCLTGFKAGRVHLCRVASDDLFNLFNLLSLLFNQRNARKVRHCVQFTQVTLETYAREYETNANNARKYATNARDVKYASEEPNARIEAVFIFLRCVRCAGWKQGFNVSEFRTQPRCLSVTALQHNKLVD